MKWYKNEFFIIHIDLFEKKKKSIKNRNKVQGR